jgi:four helix bundle protein
MKDQKYDLEARLLEYSSKIIRMIEKLPDTRAGRHISGQLIKSGTSPYANHGEAQAAESSKDFIHKMQICLKELRESKRWLKLINHVPLIDRSVDVDALLQETEELIKIFAVSIRTAKNNKKNR